MSFTGTENHEISFEDAAELTKNYRDEMSGGQVKGGYFSKAAIRSLMDPEECVGIRYYYGLDEGHQKLVAVGVDSDENDLIGEEYVCIDMAVPCPTQCGEANMLNSTL